MVHQTASHAAYGTLLVVMVKLINGNDDKTDEGPVNTGGDLNAVIILVQESSFETSLSLDGGHLKKLTSKNANWHGFVGM